MTRDLLSVGDLKAQELRGLLGQAARLKRRPAGASRALAGKTVALVFQKPSMRTRVAFEVAAAQLGGSALYLDQRDVQLGTREPIKDVARVLARYVDVVVVRVFGHGDAVEFARFCRVPVINGLSDLEHPCQAVADLLTLHEHFGRLRGLRLAYVGDGNNVLHSLTLGCAMTGVHLTAATPAACRPDGGVWRRAERLARDSGAGIRWVAAPREAVKGADVIYTDVWVSMGEERRARTRRRQLRGYQLNRTLLAAAAPRCRVMHCLPAHRGEEITEEVLEGPASLVFDQAENRLHAHKAILLMLLRRGQGARGGGQG